MADLVIQINGDVKNYEDALEKAQEKTAALNEQLKSLAEISGVAFAVLNAEIYESVKAFGESEQANNKLVQALQNTGLYSDSLAEAYKNNAEELSKLTGIDKDAIIVAQAQLQGIIGTEEVSKDLTKAIVDLSAAKGMDLNATADLIGKGIEGHTQALQRLGIHIDANLDKEDRTAKIIEVVNAKFGDQAEVANQGVGSIKGLHTAFDEFQKALGERFAPAIEAIIKGMTDFYNELAENKPLIDLIASLIIAGTAVSGLVLSVGLGAMAWMKYTAMMEAAGEATEIMSLATKGLVGATGIGLIVVILSELYLNWGTVWPKMQQIYEVFVDVISEMSGALGKILDGVFHFDLNKIKEGMKEVKDAIQNGYDEIAHTNDEAAAKTKEKTITQNAEKLQIAEDQARKEQDIENRKQEVLQAERELVLAKIHNDSAEVIQLKNEELSTLKEIQAEKNAEIRDELEAHLERIREVQDLADDQSKSKNKDLSNQILANNKAFQTMDASQKALFIKMNQDALVKSLETEKTARNAYALQQVQDDIKRRNQFLIDEQQFGTAYAAINQAMHSKIYDGSKAAFADMSQMTASHNSTLKEMGKAAAIANMTIKTAESAMNIFTGFSSIPFVGYALGIIGAAAAVAFGVEQISSIAGMADGGMVAGGIPNVDSVPIMAQQGELVVPKRNFEEVVSSVQQTRSGDNGDDSLGQKMQDRNINVSIGFDSRTASQLLTILQIEDSALGISPQGA